MENTTETFREEVTPAVELVQPAEQPGAQSHEIVIVGTAHVSEKSVQEVVGKIEQLRPDIVAVELCLARYRAITGQEEEREAVAQE